MLRLCLALSDLPGRKEGFYPIACGTQICFKYLLGVDHLAAASVRGFPPDPRVNYANLMQNHLLVLHSTIVDCGTKSSRVRAT